MSPRLLLPLAIAAALLAGCATPAEGTAGARARAVHAARTQETP